MNKQYISRIAEKKAKQIVKQFPVLIISGPRQSGKTTMVKHIFKTYKYVNLEDISAYQLAISDPIRFLDTFTPPVIIDEVQRVPNLLHQIQTYVDRGKENGMFILTGSSNFSLLKTSTQSLAGRAYILKLLPLEVAELKATKYSKHLKDISALLTKGFFPRLYTNQIDTNDFYTAYVDTYVQRDIRQLLNIKKLNTFIRFIQLVAYRTANILEYTEFATNLGASVNTIKEWFSLLEASFLIYLLRPYTKNLGKRVIKSPKMYMLDTGLISYLAGIRMGAKDFLLNNISPFIFENFVVLEFVKAFVHRGIDPNMHLYFYRDKTGHEIDIIIDINGKITPIEVKFASTFHTRFIDNIEYFNKLTESQGGYVIYLGKEDLKFKDYQIINYLNIDKIIENLI